MKIRINNRKNLNYIIILIVAIIVSIPLLSKKLNIYNNENGFIELAQGYEFYKNFHSNKGRIFSTFFNYLGTANSIFEAPLVMMILFIGSYLFDSLIITYKIIAFISLVLSGVYMHKFVDKVTQNKNISLLASVLYISAPFHLNQIYISNSLSNCLIFVFIPMTFFGLYKMFNTTEHSFHVAFGMIGLILTDLKFTIIVGIAIFIYALINIKNWQIEHVKKSIVINFIAIITVTAFYIIPLLELNIASEYVGSDINKIEFWQNRLTIRDLFVTGKSSTNVFEFGPHIIIMLAFFTMALNRLKNNKIEYIFCFIMTGIYVFMSTKYFPWKIFPDAILKFESSSDFLMCSVFFQVIVCAMNMSIVLKKFSGKDVLIISIISLIYIIALKGFIPYTNEISEIKTYDLSKIKQNEFLPKNAYENIEYLNNRSDDVEVIRGSAEIYDTNRFLTHYSFKSNTLEKNTTYEFPYIYYPGYEITYDGIPIEYFESSNGLVAIKMEPEDGTYYELNYVGTKIMNISKIISFTSLCLFGVYVYKKH